MKIPSIGSSSVNRYIISYQKTTDVLISGDTLRYEYIWKMALQIIPKMTTLRKAS